MCQEVFGDLGIQPSKPHGALEECKDLPRAAARIVKRELERAGTASAPEHASWPLSAMRALAAGPPPLDPSQRARAFAANPRVADYVDPAALAWADMTGFRRLASFNA
eukprot:3702619-Pyramimonas_sp.AAC.1